MIGFWNVQDLASGASDEKKDLIAKVMKAMDGYGVELLCLSEVLGDTKLSDDITIYKDYFQKKRTKSKTSRQLGYYVEGTADFDVSIHTVRDFNVAFGASAPMKGGNNFSRLTKRDILHVKAAKFDVYYYHANSSTKAEHLVSWAVLDRVCADPKRPFLFLGDLNCSPTELGVYLNYYKGLPDTYKIPKEIWGLLSPIDDGHTHNAKSPFGPTKTLDYAIAYGLVAKIIKIDTRAASVKAMNGYSDLSDHMPICVTVA